MFKHLFYLPGYLVRFGWNVMFTLGALKNMGDAQRALASNTTFGLAFNSVLGWIVVVVLVIAALSQKPPQSEVQAADRPQSSVAPDTPPPVQDKPVEPTMPPAEPGKPPVAEEVPRNDPIQPSETMPGATPATAPETNPESAPTNVPPTTGEAPPGPASEPEKAESSPIL